MQLFNLKIVETFNTMLQCIVIFIAIVVNSLPG